MRQRRESGLDDAEAARRLSQESAQTLRPRCTARLKIEAAPSLWRITGKTENEGKVGRRHESGRLGRPFDQTQRIVAEVLAQPSIIELFRIIETIKIKVIQV